jgi:hypothetical protein
LRLAIGADFRQRRARRQSRPEPCTRALRRRNESVWREYRAQLVYRISMRSLVHRLIVIVSLLLSILAAAPALADYGAIAWSPSSRVAGESCNAGSLPDAQQSAIGYCGVADCETIVWVENGCAAIAAGDGGKYGWAWGDERGLASYRALQRCGGVTASCRIVGWTCSG